MSLNKPRGIEGGPSSPFRKAIRCLLASSVLFIASDTVTNTEEPPKNYDYLYEGIEILPKGSPKPHKESDGGKMDKELHDSDSESQDICPPGDCQFG